MSVLQKKKRLYANSLKIKFASCMYDGGNWYGLTADHWLSYLYNIRSSKAESRVINKRHREIMRRRGY